MWEREGGGSECGREGEEGASVGERGRRERVWERGGGGSECGRERGGGEYIVSKVAV